ncbi:hypothetical protein ACQPXH_10715 [Nocardia sp. CA-135953]|uniref:hypothetical protein n=1 Tax=Nocardia sp. CA-135953 TaxID=3239978 RepID=UPI003D99A039
MLRHRRTARPIGEPTRLASLYRRLPDLRLTIDPDDIPYSPSFFTVGPSSLPIELGKVS